ncbi:WD40 repeat-like protein [Rhizodiscina lignyota]|uniref:WD40 repeat-like protein n=1 Tax=Rhizodiscina lignyota TaxID=1504668 RepID=A0A9P4IR48_9PEZI|nr:WD40 repeat-like protein [Rhizodiscina lignyota]
METSAVFKTSHPPLPSPDGLHVASITSKRLHIRSTTSLDVFRSIALPTDEDTKIAALRWSRTTQSQPWSYRILVADGDNVRVWDLRDPKWTATINNGSGGMGKVISADFGATMDELLVISDFCSKVVVWSLVSGRSVEIKDPKYSSNRAYSLRSAGEGSPSIMALLARPGSQDVLTLHAPRSYKVLKSIPLTTHDAQAMKWSPNGRWLAVWDSPSVGFRVSIHTADGNLYRVYVGEGGERQELGLGARSLEWSPRCDYLAVGGHDRRIIMLSARTFSAAVFLEHTTSIQIPDSQVWQEDASTSSKRTYAVVPQPVSLPFLPAKSVDSTNKFGISILAFNVDGSLLATKDESAPTAVWIWDLTTLTSRTILLQHSPIKKITWHPTRSDLLLIQCQHDDPVIYLWSAAMDAPMALSVPFERPFTKIEVNWLPTSHDRKPGLIASNNSSLVFLWPDGRDPPPEEGDSDDTPESDQSFDSVIEMLAGRTPLPDHTDATMYDETTNVTEEYTTAAFEDTFRGKRPPRVI